MVHRKLWLRLNLAMISLCCSIALAQPDKTETKPVANDTFWQEELSRPEPPKALPQERLNQFIEHLAKQDPVRAEELKKLRTENPEQFQVEIREEFGKHLARMRRQAEDGAGENPQLPPLGSPESPAPMPGEAMHGHDRTPRMGAQPGDNRGQWRERMEKMHTDLLAWMQKNVPDEAASLNQLREKQPEEYVIRAAETMRKYMPIMRAEKDNPKLAEVMKDDLENQRRRDELLRRLSTAEGGEKDTLVAELKTLVSQRFDLIIAKKQMQYDELRNRLDELKKDVKARENELETQKANKDKAVEEHLGELILRTEKINWEQP